VGNIGDPSGRPHLHFEIRLHNPDTPGSGYWSVDPTLAGWFPPSRTIWENRMVQQPGTVWARFPAEGSFYVGATEEMMFTVEEGELRALNIADGRVIWRHELETNFPTVLLSVEAGLVYLADPLGHLVAFSLPTREMMAEWNNTKVVLELAWEMELDVLGSPLLLPLADGAVAIALKQTTLAFSPDGEELWDADGLPTISDWLLDGEQLIISTRGNAPALWVATIAGLELLSDESGGQLAFAGNELYVYQPDGMYRNNSETGDYVNLYTLSDSVQFDRNMMELPEGGVMISHADLSDRRLLAFDLTGRLMWERSVESLGTNNGFSAVKGEL
jgi:outer membrane protein assembly factor BamB